MTISSRWELREVSRLFNPSIIPQGLNSDILKFGYLFESNYITVTGSGISQLNNVYGSLGSLPMVQTNDTRRPVVTTQNGIPCATFTAGSGSCLVFNSSTPFDVATDSYWCMALYRPTTSTGNRILFEIVETVNGNIHSTLGVSSAMNGLARAGSGTVITFPSTPITLNGWNIGFYSKNANTNMFSATGVNNAIFLNAIPSVNKLSIGSNVAQSWSIGASRTGATGFTGQIAAIFGGSWDPNTLSSDFVTLYIDLLYHWLVYRYNITPLIFSNRIWARYHPYIY